MLTNPRKAAAQAIVNIFETGSVRGDYGRVGVIKHDTGAYQTDPSIAATGAADPALVSRLAAPFVWINSAQAAAPGSCAS